MIKINHTLQVLDVSDNAISDEGIAAIGSSLDNGRISELYVSGCGITVTGAKSLAAGLINSHTIKSLMVDSSLPTITGYLQNFITVDGAIAILKAAIANGVCQEVWIDDEHKKYDEVRELINVLEDRKRQEVGILAVTW